MGTPPQKTVVFEKGLVLCNRVSQLLDPPYIVTFQKYTSLTKEIHFPLLFFSKTIECFTQIPPTVFLFPFREFLDFSRSYPPCPLLFPLPFSFFCASCHVIPFEASFTFEKKRPFFTSGIPTNCGANGVPPSPLFLHAVPPSVARFQGTTSLWV